MNSSHNFSKILTLAALLLIPYTSFGRRTVISATTREPIAYASVGIINKTLGTVTDSCGNFTLKVPDMSTQDTLKISCVGFASKCYSLADFATIPDTIVLSETSVPLKEITVKPQKIKSRTAGRKNGGGFIYINVEGYKAAGQGLAIPMKVKNRAWLKELGFSIINDKRTLRTMKFRINVYRKDGDEYELENIEPLYFDYSREDLDSDGRFIYHFPTEIMLDKGEYYVELEFLRNFNNEIFVMKSKPVTGRTHYRYASQSGWETLPFGAPLYVDYDSAE